MLLVVQEKLKGSKNNNKVGNKNKRKRSQCGGNGININQNGSEVGCYKNNNLSDVGR